MVHCHAMFCLNPHIQFFLRIILNRFRSTQLSASWYDSILYLPHFRWTYIPKVSKSHVFQTAQKPPVSSVSSRGQASRRCRPWDGNWRIVWKPSRVTEPWVFSIAGAGWMSPIYANLVKGCWRTKTQALFVVVGVTSKRVPLNQLTYIYIIYI